MVDFYRKYYIDSTKKQEILKTGVVVFDTSALLDLYYYSSETQSEIFQKVFKYLEGRLWIPAQVYFEYLKNKKKVAEKPISSYERLIKKKEKGDDGGYVESISEKVKELQTKRINEIKNQLKTLKEQTLGTEKHPYLSSDVYNDYDEAIKAFEIELGKFSDKTTKFYEKISVEIDKQKSELKDNIVPDVVQSTIEHCFQIGKEYKFSKMLEIAQEGKYRYEEKIPPGHEDKGEKEGLQKYGDLYVWKQILDYAGKKRQDFILVTNDVKEDWFEEDKKTPRFELLKEFNEKANTNIWLFSMKDFIHYINDLLKEQINEQVLQDIEAVQVEREDRQLALTISNENLQSVFDSVLQKNIYIIDLIPKNEVIRLFDNPYIFEAEDENGLKIRVIATLVGGGNYARVLHGMTNAFELKKFYKANNEHFLYYNFIIAKNADILEKCLGHLGKTKVRKLFADRSIQSAICYFNEEHSISIEKANFEI